MTSTITLTRPARSGSYAFQAVIALVVLIGIVGGVTFISQYQTDDVTTSSKSTSQTTHDGDDTRVSYPHDLWFPITQKQWEPASEGDFERKTPGHYDFWFENRNKVPIELGIKSKNCKCAELGLCILSPEENQRYQRWTSFAAVDRTLGAGFRGPLAALCQLAMHEEKIPEMMGVQLTWIEKLPDLEKGVPVDRERKPTIVAPGGAGLLRLNWGGNKAVNTAERLSVRLWTECPEDPKHQRSEVGIELPLSFVTVIRVYPVEVNFDELRQGDVKTADFFCWSSLDSYFPIKVEEIKNDPCVTCSWERLSYENCQKIAKDSPPESRVRVYCGYRVTVTLHERISDSVQMPLGPFTRRVIISSREGMDPVGITLTGSVRGDVIVGSEEDQGKIALGSFNARTGTQKIVRLTTLSSATELQVDRIEPTTIDYLKVKDFKKISGAGGQTRWELCVEVPAGCPPGPLPFDSAIYLKGPGKSARDIRIPVSGIAYQ